MDDRTRMFFQEFVGRGLTSFVFSLIFSGAFLHDLAGEGLYHAQIILVLCLLVDTVLLAAQLYRGEGFSLTSYWILGASPFKIAIPLLTGALMAATVLRSFGMATWAQIFVGTLIIDGVLITLWWKMD